MKAILSPIWVSKTETATRLRQRIEAVIDYAAVHGLCDGVRNPARWKGVLDKVFPKPEKVRTRAHHPAAPYSDVPRIMDRLAEKGHVSAYCLRFTILTGVRSAEARGMPWSEVNMKARVWAIPASRMKAGRPHFIPLSDEAIEILEQMEKGRIVGQDLVFPGRRGGLLSDVAINKTLHAIAPDVSVHGFRTSFRIWGAEKTRYPREVLEAALAHVNKDKVEAAYQRSDLFDLRRDVMPAWGAFATGKDARPEPEKSAA